MLVQAQVVPWWGTGRPAEFSPSQPVTGNATGRRIGGYDYKTESFQRPRAEHYTHFREMRNSNFFGAPSPGGRSVREITSREETERPPEESTRQIPARSRLSQEPKARWRSGRQIEPLPSRSGRLLDYESSGSPSPSQILPLTGNRKPGSNLRHARPGAGRALVGNGETGRVQSQRIPPRHGHRLPAGG